MFSFFSRKPASPAELVPEASAPAAVPASAPPSPSKGKPKSTRTTKKAKDTKKAHVRQLRTPSPSIDSSSASKAQGSPELRGLGSAFAFVGGPPITPSPPAGDLEDDLGLITDPAALHSLISNVPAKLVHEYILNHLIPPKSSRGSSLSHPVETPSSRTLTHLTSFFSLLTPPPRLHCVRCHKFFFDVENDERSCLVPHDDDSAEVEHTGRASEGSSKYETIWGCCGKTVEGDGDMGPPDGWCYEGKHTTDMKRARFRADSTLQDDKLPSCTRLHCHDPPNSDSDGSSVVSERPRKRMIRKKRARSTDAAEGPSDAEPDGDDDTRSVASSKGKRKAPSSSAPRARKKARVTPEPEDQAGDAMDIDDNVSQPSTSSAKSKGKAAAKPRAKDKAASMKTSMKPRAPQADPPQAPPSPTRSTHSVAPSSPKRSALSTGVHKKNNVSFSAANMVKTISASQSSDTDSTTTKKVVKRKTKKLSEVVPSSIDGERMLTGDGW